MIVFRATTVALGTALCLAGCGTQTAKGGPAARNMPPVSPLPSVRLPSTPPPSPPSVCPPAGVFLATGPADAAMGLRAQTVTLTNCGQRVHRLNGYPGVQLLDKDGDGLKVQIDQGARQITTGVNDPGPKLITVKPGGTARFSLVWRNTYNDITRPPTLGAAVIVTSIPGASDQRITGSFDLGSTNRLGVTAWEPQLEQPDPQPRPAAPTRGISSGPSGGDILASGGCFDQAGMVNTDAIVVARSSRFAVPATW